MGTIDLATATKSSGSNPVFFLIIIAVFGIFYMFVLRPQRARQRAAAQTHTAATPGDRVRTTAGIYGTIVSADDRDVVIEVAPGVHITMLRRAIMEVVRDEPDAAPFGQPETEKPAGDTPADDWDSRDRNV